jgi:hypothetical protein
MRLLLLLSAFLTALTGVITGTAAIAQPVESSASVAAQDQRVSALAGAVPNLGVRRFDVAFVRPLAEAPARPAQHPLYAERLRE